MTSETESSPGILHVDLDAFFASVEQRDDPKLRGRPVVVGGAGGRGVVAAASYEARQFGIRSAMPMGQAKRACPDLVVIAPRFDRYGEASEEVMKVFSEVTPLVEPLSLDEAFLDVSGARRTLGTGFEVGQLIRKRIKESVGLCASVGVARSKSLAKIASDDAKPDGILIINPVDEIAYLHALPVNRLWGVGPVTREHLTKLGIITVGDLAQRSQQEIIAALGFAQGEHLYHLAWNKDDRPVTAGNSHKSISHEETFATDITDRVVLNREIRRLAERVGERMRRRGIATRTVIIKIRGSDFHTITRSRTLAHATDRSFDIAATAESLLETVDVQSGVRLVGVGVQIDESGTGVQEALPLDGKPRGQLEETLDAVRLRFGPGSVISARDSNPESR